MSASLCKPRLGLLAAPLVRQCAAAGRVCHLLRMCNINLQLQFSFSRPPLRLAW